MNRRIPWSLCLVLLLVGAGVGAGLVSWPRGGSQQANAALDARDAEKLYSELGAEAAGLQQLSGLLAKIATLTTPSVVHIESQRQSVRRTTIEETGSGVIVKSNKAKGAFVVTNRHVINGAAIEDITIQLFDGRITRPSRIWTDAATDVAVLQIPNQGLIPARWGDSNALQIGNLVLAMGSPFGLSRSVTFGIISAKGRRSLALGPGADVLNQDFLQTDAAINPGNSGGPLIDLQGRVVGINTAIASNSGGNEGIGFSIPSNLVLKVVDQLLEHGVVRRAYLGVKLDPDFDADAAARLKLDRRRGARVTEVHAETPAARSNLRFDDVILAFDGIDVQDENHLINLVSLTPVGKRIRLSIWRNGRRITVEVVLADRSSLQQSAVPRTEPGMGRNIRPMGLTVHELDDELANQLGFEANARGLLVLKVGEKAPLSNSLELYDLIEEVARMPVRSVDDLEQALARTRSSPSVVLRVRRTVDGKLQSRLVVWER